MQGFGEFTPRIKKEGKSTFFKDLYRKFNIQPISPQKQTDKDSNNVSSRPMIRPLLTSREAVINKDNLEVIGS